jgi:hypothetical protein
LSANAALVFALVHFLWRGLARFAQAQAWRCCGPGFLAFGFLLWLAPPGRAV